MTDSFVEIAPDSTGKFIDTAQLTVNATTVQRQRMVLGDNTTAANYAIVDSAGRLSTVSLDSSASGSITTQNLNPNSGAATAGSTVALTSLNGFGTVSIGVQGTYTGALTPQVSMDGTNWVALNLIVNVNTGAYAATVTSAATGVWQADIAGCPNFRISANAAVTGTAVVTVEASRGAGMIALDAPVPTGTNVIGALATGSNVIGSLSTGTNTIGALATGSNVIGALTANQSVNVAQVAGGAASTAATGVQNMGVAYIGTGAISTAAAGIANVGVAYVGTSAVSTAAAGVANVGVAYVGTGAVSTSAAGVQQVGLGYVVSTAVATSAAGVQQTGLGYIGTGAVSTSATGVQQTGLGYIASTAIGTSAAGVQQVGLGYIVSTAIATAAAGVAKVGIVGNTNATIDAAVNTALPTNGIAATNVPSTQSGAALSVKTLSAVATATNIKGSAGNLYGFCISNTAAASVGFIQFFNTSTTTTTAPVLIVPVGSTAPGNLVYMFPSSYAALNFSNGIAINVSTTVAGTTELTVSGSVFYL